MKKLICAIMTKFDRDGNLVLDDRYAEFLESLINSGVNTLMVAGTNGEFHAMKIEERKKLLEFVVEKFQGSVEIIAHVGTTNLKDTVDLGRHALDLGVRRLAVVAPYYFKYDESSIVNYFSRVAEHLREAEIILYNIPSFTGNRLNFSSIVEIAKRSGNVVGVKDSDTRPWIVSKIKKALGKDFLIFGGVDTLVVDYLSMGADGQVSGTSNVFPKILRSILDSFDSGNFEKAFDLQKILNEIVEKISGHEVFVNANKYALSVLGHDLGYSKAPFRELEDDEKNSIESFLKDVKLWSI